MSSGFYENVYNRWVINWKLREEVLCTEHPEGGDNSGNKDVAILNYTDIFLNQTSKYSGFERFVDVSIKIGTKPTLLCDGVNV